MAIATLNDVRTATIPLGAFDTLTAKLKILEVNLVMINGEGFQGFNSYSKDVQHTYLWGCSTLASECNALLHSK